MHKEGGSLTEVSHVGKGVYKNTAPSLLIIIGVLQLTPAGQFEEVQ